MSRSFFRKPSLKKSFKARTTGRAKRYLKHTINPAYGKKGMGFLKNPKRSSYNYIYHRTSVSTHPSTHTKSTDNAEGCGCCCAMLIAIIIVIVCVFL